MVKDNILYFANLLADAYFYAMLFYILSSWIPPLRESKLGQIVGTFVEPYLGIFRRFIPPLGMIDISPLFAFILFRYIKVFALSGLATILNLIF